MNEQKQIESSWRRAQLACRLVLPKTKVRVWTELLSMVENNGDPRIPVIQLATGLVGKTRVLFYTPNITHIISADSLLGACAHELGHCWNQIHGIVDSEEAADKWATQKGFGLEMIHSFQEIQAYLDSLAGSISEAPESGLNVHPATQERINTIQGWMREGT